MIKYHKNEKSQFKSQAIAFWALAACLSLYVYGVHVEAMSSSNYKIQSDSINFGGGGSNSGSYSLQDTVGEIATGISSSTNYVMKAGYQQMRDVVLAVVPPSNVTMPAIGGVTGGTADGSTNFKVTTDDAAGYTATIQASTSPALQSVTSNLSDYVPSSGNPDYAFTYAATSSVFGFTAEGTDIVQRFKDDGSHCNAGAGDTAYACWDGLSTSPKTIVTRTSANQPSGTITTLRFRAASGSSHVQPDGQYIATTTVTVVAL